LKRNGKVEPRYFQSASILFADFKDFTLLAERWEPAALVGLLDQYFSSFDAIVAKHGLQKLKTVGDAYMAWPACRRRIVSMRSTPVSRRSKFKAASHTSRRSGRRCACRRSRCASASMPGR